MQYTPWGDASRPLTPTEPLSRLVSLAFLPLGSLHIRLFRRIPTTPQHTSPIPALFPRLSRRCCPQIRSSIAFRFISPEYIWAHVKHVKHFTKHTLTNLLTMNKTCAICTFTHFLSLCTIRPFSSPPSPSPLPLSTLRDRFFPSAEPRCQLRCTQPSSLRRPFIQAFHTSFAQVPALLWPQNASFSFFLGGGSHFNLILLFFSSHFFCITNLSNKTQSFAFHINV